MKPFKRSDRVGGLIQKSLSQILQKNIKDPRLETIMITGVKMTSDLKLARIYFTMFGGSISKEAACEGFKKARGFVKRSLARQLGLRYMPELEFFYDESFDYGDRIDRVLTSIKVENETDHTSPEK